MGNGTKEQNASSRSKNQPDSTFHFQPATKGEAWRKFFIDVSAAKIHEIGNLVLCSALALGILCTFLLRAHGAVASLLPDDRLLLLIIYALFSQSRKGGVNRRPKPDR